MFHGEDNSASDDDDLADGRRMIKVRKREEEGRDIGEKGIKEGRGY